MISAILSTVDSTLLASSAQVSNNIIDRLRPGISERSKLIAVRLTLVVLAVIAFGFAVTADNIKDLVSTASAAGSAGVFVAALFALFSRFGGPASAHAAVVVGAVLWFVGTHFEWTAPYVTALVAAFVVYVAAGFLVPARASEETGAPA